MRPLFSIITACFNAREDLLVTANSLDKQVFRDFEWIVIDGASDDGTYEVLKNLPNVSLWISEPDEGIADAWNKGVRLSKGHQILFLNAGDEYDEIMLQVMMKVVSDTYITCCHARIGKKSSPSIFRAKPNLLWRGMHVPHNWCSVPLSKYLEFGGYEKIKYSMDYEWFARYYKVYGRRGFKVVDQALGNYGLGGHSDINFVEGFKENERIMVGIGMSPVKAKLIRYLYTFKHFLRYRIGKTLIVARYD
jgi:putative colanic acid biosynthesis glycosyltransferase